MNADLYLIIWGALVIVFILAEALTLGLTSIWFAVGALGGLIAAALNLHWIIQVLAFIVVSVVLLVYTRPIAKKVFKVGQNKTNVDALIGLRGYVIKPITENEFGQVRLGGQVWSAKGMNQETFSLNEEVEVIAIEGVKLIVKRI